MHSNDVFVFVVPAFVILVVGLVIGHLFGHVDATEEKLKQAFDRGYAVQCIGKEGYYWECAE